MRYNSDDGAFEGYTDSWGAIGGSGGAEEVDTNVSSTSAVGVGSFATASFRSAEVIAQIVQIDEYQVGKYLMIHDGTTVTVIEQLQSQPEIPCLVHSMEQSMVLMQN